MLNVYLHPTTLARPSPAPCLQDDWTIRMAALRPDCFGAVLHNNLEELLEGGAPSIGTAHSATPASSARGAQPGAAGEGAAAADAAAEAQGDDSAIWQELVVRGSAMPVIPQCRSALRSCVPCPWASAFGRTSPAAALCRRAGRIVVGWGQLASQRRSGGFRPCAPRARQGGRRAVQAIPCLNCAAHCCVVPSGATLLCPGSAGGTGADAPAGAHARGAPGTV